MRAGSYQKNVNGLKPAGQLRHFLVEVRESSGSATTREMQGIREIQSGIGGRPIAWKRKRSTDSDHECSGRSEFE